VPAVRCSVLECLARQDEPVTISVIEEETGLPKKTVDRLVEDMVVLKLARRVKDSGKWYVEASSIAREYWHSERSPEMSEGGYALPTPEALSDSPSRPVDPPEEDTSEADYYAERIRSFEAVPRFGDDGFPELVLATALKAGHITEAEASERYALHKLVTRENGKT
jgi:IclR helix-turn-helix domain